MRNFKTVMKVNWKGKYSYEPEFDILNAHSFELILEYEANQFIGIAVEEEFTSLTNESPTVTGFIDGDTISFTKQYPFEYMIEDNGQITIDRAKPGHEVIYEGHYNSELGQWEGEWEIIADEIKLSAVEYEMDLVYGSWRMKTE
jgi:hypothetical protein